MDNSFIILDGAMGTMLQAEGLKPGERPELWNITHPDIIKSVHEKYIDAGSNCIYANTFCANKLKLEGTGYEVSDVVKAGIRIAREAADGRNVKVALDIGPTGELLEPYGDLEFEDAYVIFREMIEAGTEAGADLIIFETMSDLEELKAGVSAAHDCCSLPVWTTMTFDKNGRTFMGVSIEAMAQAMNEAGVNAVGYNCSVGPEDLIGFVKELKQYTDIPIILKPNAGLPDTVTGKYNVSPLDFAVSMKKGIDAGASILGGCCGTSPEYISELKKML